LHGRLNYFLTTRCVVNFNYFLIQLAPVVLFALGGRAFAVSFRVFNSRGKPYCINMFVMLFWECIHTVQAETFVWPRWESNPRPLVCYLLGQTWQINYFLKHFHIYFISRPSLPWNNVDEHFSHYGNYCGICTNNIVTRERGIRLICVLIFGCLKRQQFLISVRMLFV
jgi:hypothetical protein